MIDLHTHSCLSDGSDEPEVLVHQAEARGLRALALTDHDTLDGLPRFLALQPDVGVRLIPGIELSCRYLGAELHVIGLFVEPGDPVFQERIASLKSRRERRNLEIYHRLHALGMPLSWEQIRVHAKTDVISRVHFAQALVRAKLADSLPDAFLRFLGDHGRAFVPFEDLSPDLAALWIREAGGVPVVAHPGRTSHRHFPWDDAMLDLKRRGMAGFEAYYSEYGPTEERYFCGLAARLGMARSGGSDYHGLAKPGIQLGVGRGGLRIPEEILDELEVRRGIGPERWV